MNNLDSKKFECASCFLCADVCPSDAIKIERDDEGFYKYKIEEEKCTDCGLCIESCPQLNNESNNEIPTDCISAYTKDDDILLNSSSGGIFSELALAILNENGLVVGAAWQDGDIKHIMIDSKDDLHKLRGSKYLQSNLDGIFKQVKQALDSGKKVLFSGLPCQVTAINNYVENDNLFTIDIICHGAPSRRVFDKAVEDRFDKKVSSVNFRDKKEGWQKYFLNYSFVDNDRKEVRMNEDEWFLKYIRNYYLNLSCYDCKSSKFPRPGDITLGDFWGIQVTDEMFFKENGNRGVSAVVKNNDKGRALFDSLQERIKQKLQPIEIAYRHNPRLNIGFYDKEHLVRRGVFFKALNGNEIEFKDEGTVIKAYKNIRRLASKVKRKVIR